MGSPKSKDNTEPSSISGTLLSVDAEIPTKATNMNIPIKNEVKIANKVAKYDLKKDMALILNSKDKDYPFFPTFELDESPDTARLFFPR